MNTIYDLESELRKIKSSYEKMNFDEETVERYNLVLRDTDEIIEKIELIRMRLEIL